MSQEWIKILREKTNAKLTDCVKALKECENDLEKALAWLKEKGMASASKLTGRQAAEGFIGVASDPHHGILLELNSETDFACRSQEFRHFFLQALERSLQLRIKTVDEFLSASFVADDPLTVSEKLLEISGMQLREPLAFRRMTFISLSDATVASYVHGSPESGLPFGRIGVLVAVKSLDGSKCAATLADIGKKVAMHIAASPQIQYGSVGSLPQEWKEEKRVHLLGQAQASGKPASVLDKIVDGQMDKIYQESVLLEQPFLLAEGKVSVRQYLEGEKVALCAFARMAMGEEGFLEGLIPESM